MCKNVRIPYPLGIQLGCYMDPWFEIVCNGTGALLKKKKKNMELLEIALSGRSGLTKNMVYVKGDSLISSNPNCKSIRTRVMSLKGSPFTFSYSNNFFISFGCNITIEETDEEIVVCKSRCNTSLINRAPNSGSGFNHCTSSIPFGLQAFNVDFVSTNNKVLEGCNYAFLSDNSRLEIV